MHQCPDPGHRLTVLRHPLTLAVVLELAWHAVLFAAAEAAPLVPTLLPDLGATVVNAVAAIVPLAVAVRWGWWRSAALRWRRPDHTWLLLIPLVLLNLTYALPGTTGSGRALAGTALLCLAVGVSEEALSRGVVQRALQPSGPVRAAVWVGVLFGLGHALSAAWFARAWDDTLVQVISTTAFGFCYAALRWHLGTIWPLVLLHAEDDFLQLSSPGAAPLWWQAATALALLGYGCWLLHRLPATSAPRAAAGVPRARW